MALGGGAVRNVTALAVVMYHDLIGAEGGIVFDLVNDAYEREPPAPMTARSRGLVALVALTLLGPPAVAQTSPVDSAPSADDWSRDVAGRVYYGLGASVVYGDPTVIGLFPFLGYKTSPRASLGVKAGLQYLDYQSDRFTTIDYGAGVFARYRVAQRAYVQAEWDYMSMERPQILGGTGREWVPFLLVGGGVLQRLSGNTWGYVEVLIDVLDSDRSPYAAGQLFIGFGVASGF